MGISGIVTNMKEIFIFIAIIIIALVALFAFQNTKLNGADVLSAFSFDFKKPSDNNNQENTQENTEPTPTSTPIKTISYPKPIEVQDVTPVTPVQNQKYPEALSIYYQKIKISTIIKKNKYHSSVIKLRVSTKEEINITGFIIKTRHGEFKIPQGLEGYKSYGVEKNITTDGYLSIYIMGDLSPLSINAFRINACFGYLKQYNNFYPSISSYCPKPSIEDIYELHPFCQDYILDLKRCEIPNYSNNLKISGNSYCTSYIIENLNYPGCYQNYKDEEDFLKNYWYIYTRTDIVEPLHDIIYLYDQNGYLIDDYTY